MLIDVENVYKCNPKDTVKYRWMEQSEYIYYITFINQLINSSMNWDLCHSWPDYDFIASVWLE